jgi:hypothetical protein
MYRGDPDDGNIFLPLNSTKHVLVATFFVKFWADMEVENLVRETVCSLKSSGLCEDALSFSFFTTEDCVHIYKKVPVLDIENHLNMN